MNTVLELCLNISSFRITSSSRPCFAFSPRSHLRMLATKHASRLLQLHLIPFTLPISLNSLDREGMRLLSPRFQNQFAGADDTVQVTQPSSSWSSMKFVFVMMFHFQLISSAAQSVRSGICVAFGVVFFYFGSVVGP